MNFNCFKELKFDFKLVMITHSYVLNQTNQLVDINDTYPSFSTMYNISCDNMQDTFEYAIVNQSMLDNNQIYFKKSTGIIEDSFSSNNTVFENWYLVLKATKDTPCKVSLEITPLTFNVTPPQQPQQHQQSPQHQEQPSRQQRQLQPERSTRKQSKVKQRELKNRIQPALKKKVQFSTPPESNNDDDTESESDDIVVKCEENEEDVQSNYSFFSTQNKWSKILFISLGILILFVFVMWWTNKLHYIPFFNKFFKQKLVDTTTQTLPPLTVQSKSIVLDSQPSIVQPPPPIQPDVQIVQPQISDESFQVKNPNLNSNFINEMRELKINL